MTGWLAGTVRAIPLCLAAVGAHAAAEPPCIERDAKGDFLGWADYPHCLVDLHSQSTVRWLDDWFGHPDVEDQAKVSMRAITELVIDEEGELTPALRVRAKVRLPRISKRLSLVFEDESQESSREQGIPTVNESALALRWLAYNLDRLQIETDAGVRSGPDLFVRARFRKTWSLGEHDAIRFSQSARYSVDERLRAINEIDYTHAFSAKRAGTLYHNLDHQEEDSDQGLFWSRGGLISQTLSHHAAVSAGLGQEGVTKPEWQTESRSLWLRYRQRIWRDWLFYEVEPRLTQTRARDWDTLPAIALRLEVHFGSQRP
ncbi:hypothetical protein [Perlucidibaca piscinae]|uniref:hypothetical protein n=1 Tax=Perlucidibaca piscinae TaxID=392589 RepID=UPI00042A3B23|nr:hypothetical protein [Perlucidibaca piscinae]